jgi:hypothetical protein
MYLEFIFKFELNWQAIENGRRYNCTISTAPPLPRRCLPHCHFSYI